MRRRAILGLAASCLLAGCAHQSATPAQDMGWWLHEDEYEGAKLAFGEAQSDNVVLMMTCQPRSGEVQVSRLAARSGAIELASRGQRSRLAGEAAPAGFSDELLIEARAAAGEPTLAAFAATGELALVENGRRAPLPARPEDRERINSFFAACQAA